MYAQALIGVSFAIAAYQDVRERAVSDLVWIPAIVGGAYAIYSAWPALALPLAKVGVVGAIALAFTLYGGIGQADAIAMALIATDPFQLSPIFPLFGAAAVALSHIGYEFAIGNARGRLTIPMAKFMREQRWIPKAVIIEGVRTEVSSDVNIAREEVAGMKGDGASVEVTYGVPTVAYLGIGYIVFLAYLVVFNQAVFLGLP